MQSHPLTILEIQNYEEPKFNGFIQQIFYLK